MKNSTTNRSKFSALKTEKTKAKHVELAHTEALEMNAEKETQKEEVKTMETQANENKALIPHPTAKAQNVELSKEQQKELIRKAPNSSPETVAEMHKAAYEAAAKDVKAGTKSAAEAMSALRELMGAEFSAEFFQDLEIDGLKKIKENGATMKDAGRAVKGSEGRWTFKVKEFKTDAIEWLEEHIALDKFKSEALQARSRMNRFVPLVNFAATGSTGKRKEDFELAFIEKLGDRAETIRKGYLSAQAGQKTDTYANNLGRILRDFGAAELVSADTAIKPNYDHPLIKALAERA